MGQVIDVLRLALPVPSLLVLESVEWREDGSVTARMVDADPVQRVRAATAARLLGTATTSVT